MLAIHELEYPVGAGLDRQVQIRHQLRTIAKRMNQVVGHVVRVRRREPYSLQPFDFGKLLYESRKRPFLSAQSFAVIGIHVLPQQSQFADAP